MYIIDYCSGHDSLPALDNIKYVLLPENATATYQPLDQGIISKSKLKYRSKMLRQTIDIVSRMQEANHGFKSNSGIGRRGLQQGQFPYMAEAMRLKDFSRDESTLPDRANCWIRTQCLRAEHVDYVKCIANDTEGSHLESPVVDEAEAVQLASVYELIHLSPLPSTPLFDLDNDISGFVSSCTMQQILNSEGPHQRGYRIPLTDAEIQWSV